jgi:hypothetical protein
MLNAPWQETWKRFADEPAKFIGLNNALGLDDPANFCVVRAPSGNAVESVASYIRGAKVSETTPR